MSKYERWKNAVERKCQRVNVHKTKGMQLLFGKKSPVSSVDPCGVCGVILLNVRNVRGQLTVVALMCLGVLVYYCVGMSLSVEHILVIIIQ